MIENLYFQFFILQWNFLGLHVFKIIFLPFNIKSNLFWAKWIIFCMVWNFFGQKFNGTQNRVILAFFVDSLKTVQMRCRAMFFHISNIFWIKLPCIWSIIVKYNRNTLNRTILKGWVPPPLPEKTKLGIHPF